METIQNVLKDYLLYDLINIIYEYIEDDGIRCHKCGLPINLDNDCMQCFWIISWEQPNNYFLKHISDI